MNRATLFAGLAGGVAVSLALIPATGDALEKLARARTAQAVARTNAAAPDRRAMAVVQPGLRIGGGSDAAAGTALAERIRTIGASGGVLVEQVQPVRAEGGLLRARLRLSGPAKGVVAMIDRIERETPLVRMASWRMTALPGGGVRMEGEAVAAWR